MIKPCLFLLFATLINWSPAQNLPESPPAGHYNEAHRFLFFAVLEGCYTDGLTDADIDAIIPPGQSGSRDEYANFIFACQLCDSALDAFKLYATRKRLAQVNSDKNYYTTFGQGLDSKVRAELAKAGQPCRDAIQALIQRWITTRMTQLRLTKDEVTSLNEQFTTMREQGEKKLKLYQNGNSGERMKQRYQHWKTCPTCSGASPMTALSR